MDSSNSVADSGMSDRLSKLPDSLIISILSLLPMKDVVPTMLLSKRWKNLWTTLPCLEFSYEHQDFVSGALAHWKGFKIHKFRLAFYNLDCSLLDSWLLFAIEKQVEELILEFGEIDESFNIRSTSLKKLKLGCTSTEISSNAVLKIWAPNLLEFEISGLLCGSCLLDVPSLTNVSLCFRKPYRRHFETFNQFFQSIRHVEKLTLSHSSIKILLLMKEKNMVVEFPNASSLDLTARGGEEILGVLDMFPNLTTLWIESDLEYCYYQARFFKIDEFVSYMFKTDLPSPSLLNLKTVNITWFMRDISIIPAAEILLENAKLPDKLVFRPIWCGDTRLNLEVLLSSSASSPTAEVIVVQV